MPGIGKYTLLLSQRFLVPSMKLRSSTEKERKQAHSILKLKTKYPKAILSIESILKDNIHIQDLHTENTDGRINSIYDENTVISILKDHYGHSFIHKPYKSRHWYDLKIKSSHKYWIPCNIKVSTGGTDNALCKKALVYSLSTLHEDDIPKYMSFNKMIELIEKNKNSKRNLYKEYYYIYVDKKDGSIIVRSLCDIQNYVSNPQNWLQINWKKEKTYLFKNNFEDIDTVYHKIRSTLRDSLQKILDSSNRLL